MWWPAAKATGSSTPKLALTLETDSKARLQLHKEVSEDGGEVRLYCRSEERAHKERGIVERFSPALRAGARPTLRGALTAAGSQGASRRSGNGSGG